MALTFVKEKISQSYAHLYYSEYMRDFGDYLRQQRLKRGLSQERLAKMAGITGGALSKIESGDTDMRVSTLVGLAHALRMDPIELILVYEGKNPREFVESPQELRDIALDKIESRLQEIGEELKSFRQKDTGKVKEFRKGYTS